MTAPTLVEHLSALGPSLPIALPLLGVAGNVVVSSLAGGSRRRIEEMCKLHDKLPEANRSTMEIAIGDELGRYVEGVERRGSRHVDGGAVGALVLVAILGAAGFWGLLWLFNFFGNWWWLFVGLYALFWVLFMVVGARSVFYYGDTPPTSRRARTGEVSAAADEQSDRGSPPAPVGSR